MHRLVKKMQLYPSKHQDTRSLQTRQGWGPCPPLINTYTAHLKSTHNVTQVPVSESHRDKVSSHGQAVGPTRQETRLQPAHWYPDTLPAMTVIHILSALCHGSKFKMLQRWISSGGQDSVVHLSDYTLVKSIKKNLWLCCCSDQTSPQGTIKVYPYLHPSSREMSLRPDQMQNETIVHEQTLTAERWTLSQ